MAKIHPKQYCILHIGDNRPKLFRYCEFCGVPVNAKRPGVYTCSFAGGNDLSDEGYVQMLAEHPVLTAAARKAGDVHGKPAV